ncbi:MAG: hypothetical protein H7326_05915 [Bdellovibrionaceae bacterium]|nr:hypothetical protein [Pseudobdellovibrionaceae bacterium]
MITKALVLPTLLLTTLSIFPTFLGTLKYVPIYKTLTIRANKKLPPHIAYADLHFESKNSDWANFDKKSKIPLQSGATANAQQGPYVLTQKRTLAAMVIRKSPELLISAAENAYKTSRQSTQENEGPQWLKNIVRPNVLGSDISKLDTSVAGLVAAKRIVGHVELKDGLAVTNEHHIEVRRSDEGIFREMGRVDLAKGSYSIDVDETTGFVLARLIDKSGATLGEGSIRISQLPSEGRLVYGPRLEIAPSPSWSGNVGSYYQRNGSGAPNPTRGGRVTSLGGEKPLNVGPKGEINLDNISRGSSTVVRASLPEHMPSNKIMITGSSSLNMTNFPTAMISAMKDIVEVPGAGYRELKESTVIWGTITLDSKPLSGVTVISETDSEVKAIYFNEFLIPDPKLTSTSSNGIYAFIQIQPGFNAILAQRGDAYFGHQNVIVEPGVVSLGDIESTLKTESVRVRAFDAFAGEPVSLVANMQSLSEPVQVTEGNAVVILPHVSRLSMIYTEVNPTYVAANYFYNDSDTYIHLPAIKRDWILGLRADNKVDEIPGTGTVIGFFNDENFEAYMTGDQRESGMQIVYFDAAGRPGTSGKGKAGGGFVLFNVPVGVHEAVVVGATSERIFSKVVPIDADATSVLNFTSY